MRNSNSPADRRNVHDAAAMTASHAWNCGHTQMKRGPEMRRHRVLKIGDSHGVERPYLNNARIVDQHVERPEPIHRLLYDAFSLSRIADIGVNDQYFAAEGCQFLLRHFQSVAMARD